MVKSNMPRCFSYIRFSTPEQALGDSLRRQTELSEQYAHENGLIIDRSLNLFDAGLSGYTGGNRKKGALAVFLKAVENKIVPTGSYLLVESLDRLSRDTISEQMTLFMQLVNNGITVVTLKDKQVYNKATIDSDISRLMLSLVIMMRAHDESAMKAHRLREAWASKRKNIGTKKLTAQCPRWLTLSADRTTFFEIPERVALLRRIFQMSLDGMGVKTIARILNEEKVPQWTAKGIGWQIS
jgi:DNA invertase Pin-like site-specific DNA recombinase